MTKTFSRKTIILLVSLSVLGLLFGTLIIFFSGDLFLSLVRTAENVLHRELSLEKWSSTFYSFILMPIFIIIVFNVAVFLKYPNKVKIFLLSFLLIIIFVMILFMHLKANNYIDSDTAGEMMLWRECVAEKSLIPTGWIYSSEIRILNTQILGAIFFSFFSDWVLIKLLVSIFSLAILFWATIFLLNRLEFKEFWIKFLCAILVIVPTSYDVWFMVTFGNYYIPHYVISFLYLALFLDLIHETKFTKLKFIIFVLLAFLGSLASIRYILVMIFPLFLAMIWNAVLKLDTEQFNFKNFFIDDKIIFYSMVGIISGAIGFLGNTFFHKFYIFTQYSFTRFHSIEKAPVLTIIHTLMKLCGYSDSVSVLSPSGIANICCCIAIVLIIFLLAKSFKIDLQKNQKIFFLFFVTNFIFNTFIFLLVDFQIRFFLPITVYIIPCTFVLVFNTSISRVKQYVCGASLIVSLMVSMFSISQWIISFSDMTRHDVNQFLIKNYSFGYGTFENADITTFLTNGKLEVASLLSDTSGDEREKIPNTYEYDKILTPKYYYQADYKNNEKIFFLVSTWQYNNRSDAKIFTSGKLVYIDDYYRVYEYENHDAFRNGF